jgi:poly(A) polymerase
VLYRLKEAGYEAYLVGGGVRDLLLGREPKDFDVATNALPEEVKAVFRNCRLIGRRFRLAHVHFGREIIEVATFRGPAEVTEDDQHQSDAGQILRDNVYGTMEEDAWRRDFTVNALYYNIKDFSVVDYTGGLHDLENGELRMIGDPFQRYREDPVRMLRAVRFAAKLGFRIHPESEQPIFELGHLLQNIPPARLYEEVLKLFLGGVALQTFELLRHYGLFGYLFPPTEEALASEEEGFPATLLASALNNTDLRIAENKPVTPAFLFAALLWTPMHRAAEACMRNGMTELQAYQDVSRNVIAEQAQAVALPKRFSLPMREIWFLQPRLMKIKSRRALRTLSHPRFRAAYDFLLLRAQAGEPLQEQADWWTHFQEVNEAEREGLVQSTSRPRRRRRRSRKKTPSA